MSVITQFNTSWFSPVYWGKRVYRFWSTPLSGRDVDYDYYFREFNLNNWVCKSRYQALQYEELERLYCIHVDKIATDYFAAKEIEVALKYSDVMNPVQDVTTFWDYHTPVADPVYPELIPFFYSLPKDALKFNWLDLLPYDYFTENLYDFYLYDLTTQWVIDTCTGKYFDPTSPAQVGVLVVTIVGGNYIGWNLLGA